MNGLLTQRHLGNWTLGASLALSLMGAALAGSELYQIFELTDGALAPTTEGYDVDGIFIVGGILNPQRAFRTNYFQIGLTDLGTLPGGNFSVGLGVNGFGEVVGRSNAPGQSPHAMVWMPGGAFGLGSGMHDLGVLGGSSSAAFDLNDDFRVIGWSTTSSGDVHGFFYARDLFLGTWVPRMLDLGTFNGGSESKAYAVSEAGEPYVVSGYATGPSGDRQATLWWIEDTGGFGGFQVTGMLALEAPGGDSEVLDVDDGGTVFVGYREVAGGAKQATRWAENCGPVFCIYGSQGLGSLGGTNSQANGVNGAGQIVGWANDAGGASRAFLWDPVNGMRDLKSMLLSSGGWELSSAEAIDEAGRIVGKAERFGEPVAFLAYPDLDFDTVPDAVDNCPSIDNHDQFDSDADGVGNPCDNCFSIANTDQLDTDGDGLGDACDVCPLDAPDDSDGDGACDSDDVCPSVFDPGQEDANGDGVGDACDCNGNGVPDSIDLDPGPDFAPAVPYPAAMLDKAIVSADVDGNGTLDVVLAGHGDDTIAVLPGNGDGTFGSAVTWGTGFGTGPWDVAVADLDGDGAPDAATANILPTTLSILLNENDGTGAFTAPIDIDLGTAQEAVIAADLNGDTHVDLATANQNGTVSVLLNDGTGTFSTASYAAGDQPSGLIAALLDGDAYPDLAVTLRGADQVAVLLNNGTGTFGPPALYPVGSDPEDVTAIDTDADGLLDLAASNSAAAGGTPSVSILLNNGTGTFSAGLTLPVGDEPHGLTATDIDGNGSDDLAVACWGSASVSVLLNSGGLFDPHVSFAADSQTIDVVAADLDGDDAPDLVTADFETANILINQSATATVDCNENGVLDACDIADGTSADADSDGLPDECACPFDLDGDGGVGFTDLTAILGNWGACPADCPWDLDGSFDVGFADLTTLLGAWGSCS